LRHSVDVFVGPLLELYKVFEYFGYHVVFFD